MKYIQVYCENRKWRFAIIPGNKGKQKMGKSIEYSTKEACINAISVFKSFVIDNNVNNRKHKNIIITNDNHYGYKYVQDNMVVYENDKTFSNPYNVDKSLKTIYRYISNDEIETIKVDN